MRDIPDGSVDMICTDPPYGMSLTPQRQEGKFHGKTIINDDNLDWSDEFFRQSYRVLPRKDCGMFAFCSHHSVGKFIESAKKAGFDIKNLLVWDKDWFGMGGNWRPNHELILLVTKGRFVTKSKNKSNILKFRRLAGQSMVHPTEKPVALMEELIMEPDYEPQLILDPFAGSGTTAIAALNTGRGYICIEKDPEYYKLATERVRTHDTTTKRVA